MANLQLPINHDHEGKIIFAYNNLLCHIFCYSVSLFNNQYILYNEFPNDRSKLIVSYSTDTFHADNILPRPMKKHFFKQGHMDNK